MNHGIVYVLFGKYGRYYIGSTTDLHRRLTQHNAGKVHSTMRMGLPMKLVCSREFATIQEARRIEYRLKRWKNPQKAGEYLQKLDPKGS
jgi:putative endonuclease